MSGLQEQTNPTDGQPGTDRWTDVTWDTTGGHLPEPLPTATASPWPLVVVTLPVPRTQSSGGAGWGTSPPRAVPLPWVQGQCAGLGWSLCLCGSLQAALLAFTKPQAVPPIPSSSFPLLSLSPRSAQDLLFGRRSSAACLGLGSLSVVGPALPQQLLWGKCWQGEVALSPKGSWVGQWSWEAAMDAAGVPLSRSRGGVRADPLRSSSAPQHCRCLA